MFTQIEKRGTVHHLETSAPFPANTIRSGEVCSPNLQGPSDSRSTSVKYLRDRSEEFKGIQTTLIIAFLSVWNVDELTKCVATYTFGGPKKRTSARGRGEERERQRQEMKEGLNLTKMNVRSLHLSLILSLTRPLEYKDGERKKADVIWLSLGEESKNNTTCKAFLFIMISISYVCPHQKKDWST